MFLQPFPLVLAQRSAEAEQHPRIRFLQFGPSLGDAVDLRHHFRFIRVFRFQKRLHDGLFFLQPRAEIDQLEPALLKDRLHSSLLLGR